MKGVVGEGWGCGEIMRGLGESYGSRGDRRDFGGTLIPLLLPPSPEQALNALSMRRFCEEKLGGVLQPSQRRWGGGSGAALQVRGGRGENMGSVSWWDLGELEWFGGDFGEWFPWWFCGVF